LFNHSCDGNIKRSGVISDRIRVMKAVQPIPKGTQVIILCIDNFTITIIILCFSVSHTPYCGSDLKRFFCYHLVVL